MISSKGPRGLFSPNVKIAAIKAGDANGYFFPEAVTCAFVWAGTHNVRVTNNSYFADPWLFNCRNDPTQRAIWEAERRAIRFAMQKGTVVVAAMGNQSDDLAHPTTDSASPDDTVPLTREITNACAVVPTEVAGVIGVTANGNRLLKSLAIAAKLGKTADPITCPSDLSIYAPFPSTTAPRSSVRVAPHTTASMARASSTRCVR